MSDEKLAPKSVTDTIAEAADLLGYEASQKSRKDCARVEAELRSLLASPPSAVEKLCGTALRVLEYVEDNDATTSAALRGFAADMHSALTAVVTSPAALQASIGAEAEANTLKVGQLFRARGKVWLCRSEIRNGLIGMKSVGHVDLADVMDGNEMVQPLRLIFDVGDERRKLREQLELSKRISSKYCDERDVAKRELAALDVRYTEAHAALDDVGAPPKVNPDGISVARSVAERVKLMAKDGGWAVAKEVADGRRADKAEYYAEKRKMREEHEAVVATLTKERDDARADHIATVEDMRTAIRKKYQAEADAMTARKERDEAREAAHRIGKGVTDASARGGIVFRMPPNVTHFTPAELAEKLRTLAESMGTVVVGRRES